VPAMNHQQGQFPFAGTRPAGQVPQVPAMTRKEQLEKKYNLLNLFNPQRNPEIVRAENEKLRREMREKNAKIAEAEARAQLKRSGGKRKTNKRKRNKQKKTKRC
jgi:hypothetical protein